MKRLMILSLILALLLPQAALAQTLIDDDAPRNIVPGSGSENNPLIPGESMTTGLAADTPYLPVLVNIDNVAGAWPQWGITEADIIYEMPVYSRTLTRLMALFAYSHPENVGPVRSARVMHAEMREEWDAAWAYVGIQNKKGSNVNDILRRLGAREKEVNLLFNGTAGLFTSMKGYDNPHNHNVKLAKLAESITNYPFPERPFLFTDELPREGRSAQQVYITYDGNPDSYTNSHYIYDAQTNLYARYRGNKPYDDKNDPGVPLNFSNVIVQWTELSFNGSRDAPLLKEVGEGNADIFMGGRYIAGYWVRESLSSRTVFYDQFGEEIRLQRGKSFIHLLSGSTQLSYE